MRPVAPFQLRTLALCLACLCVTLVSATSLDINTKETRRFEYTNTPEVFDFRFAPERWQASLCLPDDPHKSIIGSDGALYYDYGGGRMFGFDTRVRGRIDTVADYESVDQKLQDARTPVVSTWQRGGGWDLHSTAWAAAPEVEGVANWKDTRHDYLWLTLRNPGETPRAGRLVVEIAPKTSLMLDSTGRRLVEKEHPERVFCETWPAPERVELPEDGVLRPAGDVRVDRWWARPPRGAAGLFRHVMIGWGRPLVLNFKPESGKKYKVAFGVIEGWYSEPGRRVLDLCIDGRVARTIDAVKEAGQNRPVIYLLDAADANGDGTIELAVRATNRDVDQNTILSGLWIFEAGSAPGAEAIAAGKGDGAAVAMMDADRMEARLSVKLYFPATELAPGGQTNVLVAVHRGEKAAPRATSVADAPREVARAAEWWNSADLPYDRITVPDPAIQALLDSCIRNIYQARDIRDGIAAFQVGPTCYRGTWAADGPFILEGITYLGRQDETRKSLEFQVVKDDGPSGVGFSKKSGLRLWMVLRHAELTGDMDWLRTMWPRVTENVDLIKSYRKMSWEDDSKKNDGLTPRGFGDGGLGGIHYEYTNVYWTLAGLNSAIRMAEMLGRNDEKANWQAEYDDYWKVFRKAADRDKQVDQYGNTYVPVVMSGEKQQLPQCGAWAFWQSLYPGRIFEMDDPIMIGNMKMLSATEEQGLVYGTGWIGDGIWNYAASFYGHGHLWLGHGDKTAAILYAFANHADPLLTWWEEQSLVGAPERYNGDNPHNWASGEFIRMIRHMMILERGRELHLLEGLPATWAAGGETQLVDIPTSFGDMSMTVEAVRARSAKITIDPPRRSAPEKIVIHAERFGLPIEKMTLDGQPMESGATLPTDRPFTLELTFGK